MKTELDEEIPRFKSPDWVNDLAFVIDEMRYPEGGDLNHDGLFNGMARGDALMLDALAQYVARVGVLLDSKLRPLHGFEPAAWRLMVQQVTDSVSTLIAFSTQQRVLNQESKG